VSPTVAQASDDLKTQTREHLRLCLTSIADVVDPPPLPGMDTTAIAARPLRL